jgi:hypothetical protein
MNTFKDGYELDHLQMSNAKELTYENSTSSKIDVEQKSLDEIMCEEALLEVFSK